MKKNMGSVDRIIRIILAAAVGVLYFMGSISGTWAIGLGIVAIVLLGTSFINFCPLYKVLGLSSHKE